MLDARTAKWPEVKEYIEKGCVAILAFGAQEEHGPHCPLSTDTIMAAGLARRLAEKLDALLLPPIPYGETWNNSRFPGTITISFSTAKALIMDIAISLKKTGLKALIIVNGHFGNRAPVELACQILRDDHNFPTLHLDYPGMARLAAEICESKPAGMGFYHADELETSIVLALEPTAVCMERAVAEYPDFPPTLGSQPIYLDEFNHSGVFGDPTLASAEKGERLLKGLTVAALQVITPFLDSIK
ncbi:MAG: creatininase family protein [Chloroflexi bacterium]|nr:creatininase family protein [Chloroflexota bacterium]